jgi:hypothetical protein
MFANVGACVWSSVPSCQTYHEFTVLWGHPYDGALVPLIKNSKTQKHNNITHTANRHRHSGEMQHSFHIAKETTRCDCSRNSHVISNDSCRVYVLIISQQLSVPSAQNVHSFPNRKARVFYARLPQPHGTYRRYVIYVLCLYPELI